MPLLRSVHTHLYNPRVAHSNSEVVNVNDLIKDHRAGVLAVRDSEIDVEGTFDASDNGTGQWSPPST